MTNTYAVNGNRTRVPWVVVMVQWLAHPTSNQGDAGSIPTHGTLRFSFKKDQSVVVHCYWLVTTSLDFQPSSYTQNYN